MHSTTIIDPTPVSSEVQAPAESHTFPVVGIGASAGGINALKEFFALMPADSGMAFVVILHLSKEHESHLAQILQNETAMPVVQVQETLKVEPNNVYVIPPAKHLKMVDGVVVLVEPDQPRGRRVPIDLLFRTLGEAYHQLATCIVLSGTGTDGTLGLERIKETGGITIVQDPEEAEYPAMPRSAIATNLVDLVLPIAEMPSRLMALAKIADRIIPPDVDGESPRLPSGTMALRELLILVRSSTGHDFSNYKRPTIVRRVARRMQVHELTNVDEYLQYVRENPDEMEALLRDLLISVTSFFRDADVFDALEKNIIPQLFEGKSASDHLRVWVAACATGEEVYSIAMLLCEHAETLANPPKIQIIASDIDVQAIATARECTYSESVVADLTPERLKRFFVREGERYRVKKSLRELVLFAQHNILHDPPFSQLDFVSCRNLLIYLNRDTQERIFEIFHFALRREGVLLLGSSESADANSSLFATVDKQHRIYRTRPNVTPYVGFSSLSAGGRHEGTIPDNLIAAQKQTPSYGDLHHKLVEQYAPPSVLVTSEFVIVHLSESVGHLLHFAGGEPSRNLLKVVHPDLRSDLRAALIESQQERRPTETRPIAVGLDGGTVQMTIRVRPFEGNESTGALFLVLFEEVAWSTMPTSPAGEKEGAGQAYMRRLEEELEQAWDRLRATNVRNETSDEELRAANEELQAIIEELRSASEELETSKEELQSVNEELTTVNHELKEKIEEASRASSDMHNFLASTDIATIFLDTALRIKRYTPNATALFNIIPADIGRPLAHLTHELEYDTLVADATGVLASSLPFEREVRAASGRFYIARFHPYRTLDNAIEGVVLTFIDIDARKGAEERRTWLSSIVSSSNDAIVSFTPDLRIVSWNAAAERLFGFMAVEVLGEVITRAIGPRISPAFDRLFALIAAGETVANVETLCPTKEGGRIEVSLSVSPIHDDTGALIGVTAIVQDITERRIAQQMLRDSDRRKDEFLAVLGHELRNPLAPILSSIEIMRTLECAPELNTRMLDVIERQSMQLLHLVDDLLDMSRITEGKIVLRRERIDISAAVAIAVETSQSQIDEAGMTLTTALPDEPIHIDADLTRIVQVLVNILNNAARYGNRHGTVELRVSRVHEKAEIRIRDTGIGIPPAMLSRIFEMFSQIEGISGRKRGGLGIGLSVVRKLVEMHDGTVIAWSEGEGKGSEFVISLPIAGEVPPGVAVRATRSVDPIPPPPLAPSRRILVVDDNRDAAEMLEILLANEGHTIHVAADGASAIDGVPAFRPEVCLLDIGLPDMSGYEVARRIRGMIPGVMLVALTGLGQEEDRQRAMDAGFDHHLVKPIAVETLRTLLKPAKHRST